jgi:ABC-type branched-subunit amino acid transport system substrate-binding protein
MNNLKEGFVFAAMTKSIFRLATLFIFTAIVALQPSFAAGEQKVHVFLDFANFKGFANDIEHGLRMGLQQSTGATWVTTISTSQASANVHTVTTYTAYKLAGTSIEAHVIVSHIARTEDAKYKAAFHNAANDPNTVAIVCMTSGQCSNASTNTNVLVVSPTATSSTLASTATYPNMIQIAPSNKLQAKAIYQAMSDNNVNKFAVAYDPNIYGEDLYSALFAEYASESYKKPVTAPKLLAAYAVYDGMFSSATNYRAVTAGAVMNSMRSLVDDGLLNTGGNDVLVYLGDQAGFKALMAQVPTSSTVKLLKWYGGDSLYDTTPRTKLSIKDGIQQFSTFIMGVPSTTAYQTNKTNFNTTYATNYANSTPGLYTYLGYDTGLFVKKAIVSSLAQGGVSKANVLTQAKIVTVDNDDKAVTGRKGLGETSKSGSFTIFNLSSDVQANNWTEGQTIDVTEE